MALAGVAWGAYSLLGRASRAPPLSATAANFARTLPLGAAGVATAWAAGAMHASPLGLALAAASGALASGLGYALWYAALPALSASRAAALQLLVPVLASGSATAILGERPTARFVAAAAAILGGVAIATRGEMQTLRRP